MKNTIFFLTALTVITTLLACSVLNVVEIKGRFGEVNMAAPETAYIYQNKKTGGLIYCSNKHVGQPRDFDYKGTAQVAKKDIRLCELA